VTILSGGHALLIGFPVSPRPSWSKRFGITLGLDAKRIQFTPDLMPSDILGAEVLDESESGKRSFRFISGPVFAQLLMADEIQPRQPADAIGAAAGDAEQHITVAGARRYDLPKTVSTCSRRKTRWSRKAPIRCRKPSSIRFLMEIDVDYSRSRRRAPHPVRNHRRGGDAGQSLDECGHPDRRAAAGAAACPVGDSVVEAILSLCARRAPQSGRRQREADRLGPGPARQPVADAGGSRPPRAARRTPRALDRRRGSISPNRFLKHRMALTFSARAEGRTIPDVIRQ